MKLHSIHIRTGSPEDNLLLAELGARTFHATFAKDNTPEDMTVYLAETFGPEQQATELADPATTFLIAEIDGKPAGYARLHTGPAPEMITGERPIEIARLYTDAQWIGGGVGAALMSAALDYARSNGNDTIWLGVWEHNERAITFYRKWKFTTVGEQPFRLGADIQRDYVMQRSLAEK
jgi:GNAT superfamily N-acetyltransferase